MTTADQPHAGLPPVPDDAASALVQDLRRELELLSRLLRQEERRSADHRGQLEWFARVHQRLSSHPRWWWLLPKSRRDARRLRRLKAAGLFDGDAYLRRYPDVDAEGSDPLHHFVFHGIYEDRVAIGADD